MSSPSCLKLEATRSGLTGIVSFGFAAELLDEARAAALFLYNVFLRLGAHLEAADESAIEPYGSIPLMLLALLKCVGWIELADGGPAIRLTSTKPAEIVTVMRACAEIDPHRVSHPVVCEVGRCLQLVPQLR